MKNFLVIIGLTFFLFGFVSFKSNTTETSVPNIPMQQIVSKFSVPDNVKAILENSCLQCHGSNGNVFAKTKWNYTKMAELKSNKLAKKLLKIVSKIEKDKMPPKKYLKSNPHQKLSGEEKEIITTWAKGLAEELNK